MTRMQKKHSQQLYALSETTPMLNSQQLYVSLVKQPPNSEQIDLKAYAICYN